MTRNASTYSVLSQRAGTLVLLTLWLMAGCRAGAPVSTKEPEQLENLIARRLPAFVFIGGGSGVTISSDGYVVTNAHVASQSRRWRVRTADGTYRGAKVVGFSTATDLCLLKIDHAENLPFIPLADSDETKVGDMVIAVGNPFGLGTVDGKPTVTLGVVSATHLDRPHAYDAIQTDTAINPGNSGGPLINLNGELVGINAQIVSRYGLRQNTGVGYAVSSNQIQRFLPALMGADGKEVPPGQIAGIAVGLGLDRSVVITEVDPKSDAARVGLRKGDVIRAVGNAPVESLADFAGAVGRYPNGAEIPVTVERRSAAEPLQLRIPVARRRPVDLGIEFNRRNRAALQVEAVRPGSPAQKAGLRKGDIVLGAGEAPLRTPVAYQAWLEGLTPGMTVPMVIQRGNRGLVLAVVLEETPQGAPAPKN